MTLDRSILDSKYAAWRARLDQMHQGVQTRANEVACFTPLPRPLSECTIGLLTTAGAYVASDAPFNVKDPAGDPTFRLIPDDVELGDLRFAHSHYDTMQAEIDPNVVLPLDALHEHVSRGLVGRCADVHVGMMGFNPDPITIVEETAPRVAQVFAKGDVDAVVLTPG